MTFGNRLCLFHVHVCLIVLCGCFAARAETTESLLIQAVDLTRDGRFDEAHQRYIQIAGADPLNGFPLLARFRDRTGQTTAAMELLENPEVKKLSPLGQGRVAVAAGKHEKAVEILKQPAEPRTEYAQAILLAKELTFLKRQEQASDVLLKAITSANMTARDRMDLFGKMDAVRNVAGMRTALLPLVDTLLNSSQLPYPEVREVINQGLNALSSGEGLSEFHRDLQGPAATSGTAALVYAISCLKRGDQNTAAAVLKGAASLPLTPREQLAINEEYVSLIPNNLDQLIAIYPKIIPLAPDPDRLRLSYSQALFKKRNLAPLMEELEKIDSKKLSEREAWLHTNMRIAALASQKKTSEVLTLFTKSGIGTKWDGLKEIADAPFVGNADPQWIRELRDAARQSLAGSTESLPVAAIAAMASKTLNDNAGAMQDVGTYVQARPGDTSAVEELAQLQLALTKQLRESAGTPSYDELKKSADDAAKSLWRVIEARPFDPDGFVKLMQLYAALGQEDMAKKVPLYLASGNTSTSAEQINLAGFILATNGYPAESLPVYEKALKLDPTHPKYRQNYAGALTRVGRGADALPIYKDIIKYGSHGKQYHTHEVFLSAYDTAQSLGKLDEIVKFLKDLVNAPDVAQQDVYLSDAGKLFITKNRFDDAALFFETLKSRFPAKAGEADQSLVDLYIASNKFDKADLVLADVEKRSTNTQDLVAARYERAFLKTRMDKPEQAAAAWEKIADEFPKMASATRGLVAAAQVMVQSDKKPEAKRLLEKYLALDTGDSDAEQSARTMLATIEGKGAPAAADGHDHSAH